MKHLLAILTLLLIPLLSLKAQYELKPGTYNLSYQSTLPFVANPPATNGQFSSVAVLSASAGPISNNATVANRYPSNEAKSIVLVSASVGSPFAAGVPRYSLGDQITPPLVKADGVTPADANYWRAQPVYPGENIAGVGIPIPLGSVVVTNASVNSNTVTVSSTPPELIIGATLLGQPVTRIVGTTVTIAGNASTNVTSPTTLSITPASSYYYSPHAEKVFAHQPGRVEIKWISRLPEGASYGIRDEIFGVSPNSNRPIRSIFWTEGNFDGPKVQITDGRITTVNPVYNNIVPKAVAQEVAIPGYAPTTPNLDTLVFSKFNGVGQLKAYNVEGRILIEYLGDTRIAGGIHDFVDIEVVEIKRIAPVSYTSINLGQEIVSSDGDTQLIASPLLITQQSGTSYYGTSLRPDQSLAYFAERITSPANEPDDGEPLLPNEAYNKVVFYWLESADYNIKWPHHQDRYWLRWSPTLSDYAHYTVDASGNTPQSGISFQGGSLPQITHQDDPTQTEAKIDTNTQRFYVNPGADMRNRSLLKFTNNGEVWYIAVYSQTETRKVSANGVLLSPAGGLFVAPESTSPLGLTLRKHTNYNANGQLQPIDPLLARTPTTLSLQTAAINISSNIEDNFALTWTGWFNSGIEGAGTYTFGTESDDGSIIYLDLNNDGDFNDAGELIVDNDGIHGPLIQTASVTLPAGIFRIAIGFVEVGGGETIRVRWKKTSDLTWANLNPLVANSGHFTPEYTNTVSLPQTAGLEEGMVVSGNGLPAGLRIKRITSSTIELTQAVLVGNEDLSFTVESDNSAPINASATVGTRLTQPIGHENAGYISAGTAYYPAGYRDPFVVGVDAANLGAIIPVNAIPGNNTLNVRWFKKIAAPTSSFQNVYVPGKIGRYTINFPATTTPQIVIAQGVGTDDLPPAESLGSVYYQNDSTRPGYNPNEEHAFMIGGRAYALRDDLNITSGSNYTSKPCLLLAYTDPTDGRPAIHAYNVIRSNSVYKFDFTATAGTLLVKPYPLPLMPLPLTGTGSSRRAKDLEITDSDIPPNENVSGEDAYRGYTFQDRKGFTWIHRGPHVEKTLISATYGFEDQTVNVTAAVASAIANRSNLVVQTANFGIPDPAPNRVKQLVVLYRTTYGTLTESFPENSTYQPPQPTLTMKFYYLSQEGFFIPGSIPQPPVGTILPFLRNPSRSEQPINLSAIDTTQADGPLGIIYRPSWPAQAPELLVAETLTLPKFGLPQVRGQTSASILYQQSIATTPGSTGLANSSVVLHDPTREKTYNLDTPVGSLPIIPDSILTTSYQGKTYFQRLSPALQQRFYYDPLRGARGALVLTGKFHDVAAGEDYLDLNLLSEAEETDLRKLIPDSDEYKPYWWKAIDELSTRVETLREKAAVTGAYEVDPGASIEVGENDLALISSPETQADSYAVTATGKGTGYVTMVFGNGRSRTPEGDPVQVKIFKVAPRLYTGDLKVVASSNPLDEQVALRHSADFMGKPENYEFEWRWTTGAATAPAVYTTSISTRIGNPALNTHRWKIVEAPAAVPPLADQYTQATTFTLPRIQNVRPVAYTNSMQASGLPSVALRSETGIDFTNGVPGDIFFSGKVGTEDGFVLYVNGTPAIAYRAPEPQFTLTNSSSGLSPAGLNLQFRVPSGFFSAGPNTIEVAIYSGADLNSTSDIDFRLEAATETDAVVTGGVWQSPSDPSGINTNTAIVGGAVTNPFGGSSFVLNDRWFTMRYKPKASANNVLGTPYSRWMPPVFVEGWVKRVLAAINPFEQRVKDLYNNAINTDVSAITQAGKRWEGDIALTLGNINQVGLIEIYETVLNRAKSMSIDANTNDPDTNNALILAAGYLNDLYTLLGNEAYADAANPTISVEEQGVNASTQINTSRFSFEGQVATSLDEELALLRGRDDSVSPGVGIAPAYNRLYWNYTRGINSGEAIYALNYNIKEKVGSTTADGVIDEFDAQRMFPQGHGDAYGHYLTALKGYSKLLTNPNFTWPTRAEAVTILGQPVTIDYFDERKFAAAAGNIARTAGQVINLTWRKYYNDNPASGWNHLRDTRSMNSQTGVTPRQGFDEWVSRSTQGALFNWAVANSLLPVEDLVHTGVQKIDRTTVPEISQLPTYAAEFQATMDGANAHLNPLGLSSGAIAFDISPASILLNNTEGRGATHYEQIAERALNALNNAAGAFNQAARMTGALRNQENTLDDFNAGIVEQERAYVAELISIFGSPYSGEIGPGKTYAQGYVGPDLYHWYKVDRPNDLMDTKQSFSITIKDVNEFKAFTGNSISDIVKGLEQNIDVTARTVTVNPSSWVQYNDTWTTASLGSRAETGELQDALQDAQVTLVELSNFYWSNLQREADLRHSIAVFDDLVKMHQKQLELTANANEVTIGLNSLKLILETAADSFDAASSSVGDLGDALAEVFPKSVGLATDATAPARGGVKLAAQVSAVILRAYKVIATASAGATDIGLLKVGQELETDLTKLGFTQEETQAVQEFATEYRDYISHCQELMLLTLAHQQALQKVNTVLSRGNRILANREIFRQRAAATIQGYRTRDVSFRLFRNEALEQYRSLFDLASRYTYLAAKSYDYETGLLGSTQGQTVFKNIVASRALGDLTGGTPRLTTSSIGDGGLASTMARLNADFSVAEGRLGLNNPDQYGTVFSLRSELFRIRTDQSLTGDDEAWQQTLESHISSNLLSDPDVATYCRNLRKPDGTPVPGIIIPFSTTIQHGKNFFGLELAAGDHAYTPSNFATKIFSVGIALPGYVGMDAYAAGNSSGAPASSAPNALSATPYVYLIPCGYDYMLAPPLGDTNTLRSWKVEDQALPLPFNLGATAFNGAQFFNANDTLSEKPWIIRKHQAFRPVSDPTFFYSDVPAEFTNSRLIARSAWNSQWKLVIPAYTLLANEQEALNRFSASVRDIQLFLRTYSNSGN